jgi:hypothetical protein
MANPESRMTVTFTKKYIKIKSLEAEVAENIARVESIKARGGNEFLFDDCANNLSHLSIELLRMADADEDGNLLRATCQKCGQKLYDPMGKNAMIYHCHCGNEFKIDKLPGGLDLTPDLIAMFNEKHGGGDNAGREQANDPTA